jgi:hypothetical protein
MSCANVAMEQSGGSNSDDEREARPPSYHGEAVDTRQRGSGELSQDDVNDIEPEYHVESGDSGHFEPDPYSSNAYSSNDISSMPSNKQLSRTGSIVSAGEPSPRKNANMKESITPTHAKLKHNMTPTPLRKTLSAATPIPLRKTLSTATPTPLRRAATAEMSVAGAGVVELSLSGTSKIQKNATGTVEEAAEVKANCAAESLNLLGESECDANHEGCYNANVDSVGDVVDVRSKSLEEMEVTDYADRPEVNVNPDSDNDNAGPNSGNNHANTSGDNVEYDNNTGGDTTHSDDNGGGSEAMNPSADNTDGESDVMVSEKSEDENGNSYVKMETRMKTSDAECGNDKSESNVESGTDKSESNLDSGNGKSEINAGRAESGDDKRVSRQRLTQRLTTHGKLNTDIRSHVETMLANFRIQEAKRLQELAEEEKEGDKERDKRKPEGTEKMKSEGMENEKQKGACLRVDENLKVRPEDSKNIDKSVAGLDHKAVAESEDKADNKFQQQTTTSETGSDTNTPVSPGGGVTGRSLGGTGNDTPTPRNLGGPPSPAAEIAYQKLSSKYLQCPAPTYSRRNSEDGSTKPRSNICRSRSNSGSLLRPDDIQIGSRSGATSAVASAVTSAVTTPGGESRGTISGNLASMPAIGIPMPPVIRRLSTASSGSENHRITPFMNSGSYSSNYSNLSTPVSAVTPLSAVSNTALDTPVSTASNTALGTPSSTVGNTFRSTSDSAVENKGSSVAPSIPPTSSASAAANRFFGGKYQLPKPPSLDLAFTGACDSLKSEGIYY